MRSGKSTTNPDVGSLKEVDPRFAARVLLTAAMLGASYLDFFSYKTAAAVPAAWNDILAGRAAAPEQYRVGVVWAAHWIVLHLHVAMPFALAAIDGLCGLVAVLVLFRVLERTDIYHSATFAQRWLGAATFVLLVQWFLVWLLWFQKPETLPAAMFIALMMWLWQGPLSPSAARRTLGQRLCAPLLFILSVTLAFVRADIACLLNGGIFLALLLWPWLQLSLQRSLALMATAAGALAAVGLQLYLARFVYPQAAYGRVKLMQLWPNLHHATRWPPFLIFMLPLAWMTRQVWRQRFRGDAAGLALLTATVLYLLLWVTIGKIDEVRIFLPFALALAPLTAQMAMLQASSRREETSII